MMRNRARRSRVAGCLFPFALLLVGGAIVAWGYVRKRPELLTRVRETVNRVHEVPPVVLGAVIVGVGAYILIRRLLRRWVVASRHWDNILCPRCGKSLHRTRRNALQRFIVLLLGMPLWRYRCENRDCRWCGLRRRRVSVTVLPGGTPTR
jgi:hypothetical protein